MATPLGTTIRAEGQIHEEKTKLMLEYVKKYWRNHYSISFNNYGVEDAYAPKEKVINSS